MLKINKIFAIVVILAIVSAALPLSVQSDVVQVTYTIQVYQGEAKPDSPGKAKPTPASPDYKLILNKGTTDIPVTLTVYTATAESEGISANEFKLAVTDAASEWDSWTGADLIAGISEVSFGSTSVDYDGVNAVFFAVLDSNVIAMASFWYSRATREILECDIRFNVNLEWGTGGAMTVYDVQNIATHEAGHWLMLLDMYNKPANEQTMYGRSAEFDLQKRSLESGDIAGVLEIYPAE